MDRKTMNPATKPIRIVIAGNCYPDNQAIKRLLTQCIPAPAEIQFVDSAAELKAALSAATITLVIVNRIFDVTGENGVETIRNLKSSDANTQTNLMLLSNYEWAQDEAIAAGAIGGFGKSSLNAEATKAMIRQAIGISS
ncbi:MAG: hypothetical protein R3C03_20245 [Pirellulaceae bacterium]